MTVTENIIYPHARLDAARRRILSIKNSHDPERPIILPLIGPSRVGKTSACDAITFIANKGLTPEQMAVVYVPIGSNPTFRGIQTKIGAALGLRDIPSRATTDEITHRLIKQTRSKGARMIILDEAQHLVERSLQKRLHGTTDWLKSFVDSAGVSCVLSGLPSLTRLLALDDQLAARAYSTEYLLPYCAAHDRDKEEFKAFVDAVIVNTLEKYELADDTPTDIDLRLAIACGGRIPILLKVFRWFDQHRLKNRTLRIEHLARAFSDNDSIANEIDKSALQFLKSPDIEVKQSDLGKSYQQVLRRAGFDDEFCEDYLAKVSDFWNRESFLEAA